jgi:hypothetical protein
MQRMAVSYTQGPGIFLEFEGISGIGWTLMTTTTTTTT